MSRCPADDSFPESNSTVKKGFSYSVMGIGVQYKLISGISISPDHSIGLRRGPKLVGHNIRRVGYLRIMGDVVPHWRRSAGS